MDFLKVRCYHYKEHEACTALMVASLRGSCDLADLILKKAADVSIDHEEMRSVLDQQDSNG